MGPNVAGVIGTAVAAFVAEFWPYILVAVAIIAVLAGIAALFNKKNKDAAEAGKDYDKNFSEGITDGKDTVKEAIRDMTDDEATIVMVDSNLQREQILPSEKAFAYKMKLDAMKRQAGRPSKDNLRPVGADLIGTRSDELLAENSPDSARQIQRYIRLTHLTPEILDLVDNSVLREKDTLQISLRPAVELSDLSEKEQQDLFEIMESEDCTPSHAQAIKMRQFSQEGRLDANVLLSIMQEEKPNQVEQFKMPKERISKFFSPGTPAKKMEDTIVKALELYRKRQRDMER